MGRPASGILSQRDRIGALLLVATALWSTGCAHRVLIQSEPAGARIYVDGKLAGQSPVLVERTTSTGGRMVVTAQLDHFEPTTTVVEQSEWFPWPAFFAVTPLLGAPCAVFLPVGPFVACGWACVTSPTLLSLALLRKYPDQVTVKMKPRVDAGLILPTDGWMIPDDYDPNPPPPLPKPAPKAPPEPKRPPQPEGANPVP